MCLYPKYIRNRKYTVNKKNGGEVPTPSDPRLLVVPVGCGECMECRKKRGREWNIRLQEEIRHDKKGEFVTLTFSNESIKELHDEVKKEENIEGYDMDNAIATKGVRRWLERWRKRNKISVKHWLITELGHSGTENIHLHGIVFGNKEEIKKTWQYGWVYIGDYVNEQTINYCIKYATKIDEINKGFKGKILTSKGIGKGYTERKDAQRNKYSKNGTNEEYVTRQGVKMGMPIYLRHKLYTEEEREKLWLEKINTNIRWINGKKIDISNGEENYYKELAVAQAKSERLGYGKGEMTWSEKQYQNARRNYKIQARLDKAVSRETEQKNTTTTWEQELQRLTLISQQRKK